MSLRPAGTTFPSPAIQHTLPLARITYENTLLIPAGNSLLRLVRIPFLFLLGRFRLLLLHFHDPATVQRFR